MSYSTDKGRDSLPAPTWLMHLTAIIISILVTYYCYLRSLRLFPPGPRGFPLLGAILSMPKEKEWLTYARWVKKYGGIIGINIIGHKIVVLNTPELVTELLDKRGAIYSDRPKIPMLELAGLSDWSVGLMPYGPRLHTSRKLLLQAMSPHMLRQYAHIQEREVYGLLQDLLASPSLFYKHLKKRTGGIMFSIFLGHRVESDEDECMAINDEHIITTSRAGSFSENLINTLPSLRFIPTWFPGAQFQQTVREGRLISQKVFDLPMQLAKRRVAEGNVVPCFMNSILENGENVSEGQAVAATSYSAGAETTTSTLTTFILAMTLNPDAQRKAQAEITKAIGTRLPRLEDREKLQLPFIDALIKETHRWNPPGNLGVPHRLMKDDEFQGYVLPQGTIILSNIWAILHDESRYPRPLEYSPERYIDQLDLEDPREHIFGYGRRVCPGRNLAEATVWLVIVSILSAFDITPDSDEEGKMIPVTPEYTSGVMSRPRYFQCSIKPRYGALANNLMQSLASLNDPEKF